AQTAPAELARGVANGKADPAHGRDEGVGLPYVQRPRRDPVVEADERQGDGDPEEALVDQNVGGSAVGDPEHQGAGRDHEVDDGWDAATGDVGERVLADVTADVEVLGQLVTDLVGGHGTPDRSGRPADHHCP